MTELHPARELGLDELARTFTAAYEGYVVPFEVGEEQLRFMVETFDIDLDASRVAVQDGEAVGLANLAIRGDQGWIGGLGVVPAARRGGLGRLLMEAVHEQARARGLRRIWLEVIEQNEGAHLLYTGLGYRDVRWVELGVVDHDVEPAQASEVDADAARARIRELGGGREPWQRSDETLAHYGDLRGLATDGAAALFRVAADGRAVLLQLAGDEQAAGRLLAALRSHGVVVLFNVPEGDPALAALRALGGRITLRQREMALEL
jgi:GNAT superfamily N-acetyltransferase